MEGSRHNPVVPLRMSQDNEALSYLYNCRQKRFSSSKIIYVIQKKKSPLGDQLTVIVEIRIQVYLLFCFQLQERTVTPSLPPPNLTNFCLGSLLARQKPGLLTPSQSTRCWGGRSCLLPPERPRSEGLSEIMTEGIAEV